MTQSNSAPLDRRYDSPRMMCLLRYYSIEEARAYLTERGLSGVEAHELILSTIRRMAYGHLIPEWKSWFRY